MWARLANDEDAQETIMVAYSNGGHLSHSAAQKLSCGDTAFSTLKELELVEPMRLDGSLALNMRGKKVAGQLAEDLEQGHLRQEALERSVLKVARTVPRGDRLVAADVLERMEPSKYGQPWDVHEIEDAIDGLHKDGLVEALPTQQGTLLRGITREGHARLSPASRANRAGSIVTDRSLTISGDYLGNVATGDHAKQASTVTVNSIVSEALQHLLDHVDDLPEQVQDDVRDQVEAAHAQLVQASPDTVKAVRWLDRAGATLAEVAESPKVANFLAVLQLVSGVLLGA